MIQLSRLHKRKTIECAKKHLLSHGHIIVAEQVNARELTQRFFQLQIRRNAVVHQPFVREGFWSELLLEFHNHFTGNGRSGRWRLNGFLGPSRGQNEAQQQSCERV